MHSTPFLLHALSPLHAGTGQASGIIDLPIARMKATGIPFVPGSSIKGVLRDSSGDRDLAEAVFGPSKDSDPNLHAGALVVSDARLLALPVRTFRGVFAWITCPLLLTLASRDLGSDVPAPRLWGRAAQVPNGSICVHDDQLLLEDLNLPATISPELDSWAKTLAPLVFRDQDIFTSRLVMVDDDTMAFLSETATQVDARVRLASDTRTVAPGALWFEESLPPETLLIGLMAADRSRRRGVDMKPEDVLDFVFQGPEVLQFGGKATTGRGRCRLVRLPAAVMGTPAHA